MNPTYSVTLNEGHPDPILLTLLEQLYTDIFQATDAAKIATRLEENRAVLTALAYHQSEPVGFKLGYAWPADPAVYYSWLGGVLPAHRKAGVARMLMHAQHTWCLAQGYTQVRTHTLATNSAMLALNYSFGFVHTGTEHSVRGEKLILLKRLS